MSGGAYSAFQSNLQPEKTTTMRIIYLLLLLPLAGMAQSPQEFKLKGKLNLSRPIEQAYITYRNADDQVSDSFQLKEAKFAYTGKIAEPTLAVFRVKYAPAPGEAKPKVEMIQVFLEEGRINLTAKDSLKNNTVTRSQAHTEFQSLQARQKPYNEKLTLLYQEWSKYNKEKNKAEQKKVEDQIEAVNAELKEAVYHAYLKATPNSKLALYALKQYAGWNIDGDKVDPLFNALPAKVQQWPSAVALKEQIEIAKKTGIGKTAMDFTQNDTLGNPVSLSSFKGKYVLVDFWASWCGPCRVENPNVVRVFNQYKDKGFTVLGVSLDRPNAKDKWLKAIHDDKLTWTHVSDLKFWDNDVAKQYGIKAIPQNLLIDPQGVIIAKNLRGEDLEAKLGEVLGSNVIAAQQ
jgi:peroxiredoxin